eukprot:1047307_1
MTDYMIVHGRSRGRGRGRYHMAPFHQTRGISRGRGRGRGRAGGRHRPRFIRHSEYHVTPDRFPRVDAMYGTNQAPQSPYDEIPLQPRYDISYIPPQPQYEQPRYDMAPPMYQQRSRRDHESRGRPRYRPRARGRARGRFVHRYIPAPTDNLENLDSMTPKLDPVVEKILHQLSYPKKKNYAPKDFIWVNRDDEWCICIITFIVSDRRFIVRPFGGAQSDAFSINDDQIHDTAEALSLAELRRSISSLKTELQNIHRIKDDKQRDLFQGTLVKHEDDTFGEVIKRHDDGTFSLRIRDECKWYNGPRILNQIARDRITLVHESELKCQTLLYEAKFNRQKPSNPRTYHTDNEDERAVYRFLNELGEIYITTFLENGISNIEIALCLEESDLKEMKIKLGHRRYIMKQIETFDAHEFNRARAWPRKWPNVSEQKDGSLSPSAHQVFVSDRAPKLIIYDFDRTLTCSDLLYDAHSSKHNSAEKMVNQMEGRELIEVFGGRARCKRLNEHLLIVTSQGVEVAIVSVASVSVITAALKRMNLFDAFFANSIIIGGDSIELEQFNGNKGKYIKETLVKSSGVDDSDTRWDGKDILFVDDDPAAIEEINEENVCQSILIEERRGLTDEHMTRIENMIKKGSREDPKELEGFAYCNNDEGPNQTQ